jgi:hypothetical protein
LTCAQLKTMTQTQSRLTDRTFGNSPRFSTII